MASDRYLVVITTARGGHLARIWLKRRQLRGALAAVALALAMLTGLGLRLLPLRRHAREAAALQGQLAVLAPLAREVAGARTQLRCQVADAARALALLDSKTHAGPSGLAAMPATFRDAAPPALPSAAPTPAAWASLGAGQGLTARIDGLLARASALEGDITDLLEYWRDAQQRLTNTPSIRPARTAYATSSYGVRIDPLFHDWVMHKGLDLGGYIGMLIYAPADGVVIWTGVRGGYGQVVVIDHGLGLQTHYAHLSRYLVQRGQSVRRGQPIAEMGTTGKSTGPHLHYEVRQDGVPQDPRKFILD